MQMTEDAKAGTLVVLLLGWFLSMVWMGFFPLEKTFLFSNKIPGESLWLNNAWMGIFAQLLNN